MNFSTRIDESNQFFKAFQMVITIGARTSKIAPRSSRYPPRSRSTFKDRRVKAFQLAKGPLEDFKRSLKGLFKTF